MNNIYLLPGFGGRLDTGLGGALLQRGFNFSGRETIGDFRALPEALESLAAQDEAAWIDARRPYLLY